MSLGYTILAIAVYVLAVARLTRLVNADAITDPVRLFVARRARTHSDRSVAETRRWATVSYFLGCPWCVGLWIALIGAFPVVVVAQWPFWVVVPVGLACSHLVGVGSPLAADETIEIVDQAVEG